MRLYRFLLASLLSLILAGCSSLTKPLSTPEIKPTSAPKSVADLTHFSLNGAVAIMTPDDAFSASLYWQQASKSYYAISLFGPLGMGAIKIQGTPNLVTLQTNQRLYQAATPEILLRQYTTWILPVTHLFYWVRGLPAPTAPYTKTLDPQGNLSSINQEGWQIHYLGYTTVNQLKLPNKIMLNNDHLSIKLMIGRWQL